MTVRFKTKNGLVLVPTVGVVLFVLLYVISSFYYPGGSQSDRSAVGFSWVHNYWCNLLDSHAINGQRNTAQPVALTALLVLCFALSFFWWQFPRYLPMGIGYKWMIQICGTFAMAGSLLLLTPIDHDVVTNLSSLFGIMAMVGTFVGLHRNKWNGLFVFGLVNILLVLINNIFYYHKYLIWYLPVVQKVTFASMLLWICCINLRVYRIASEGEQPMQLGRV